MTTGDSCDLFVQLPNETASRVLHGATTVRRDNDTWLIRVDDDTLPFEPGQSLFVYFERQREFMQQPATVVAIEVEPAPEATDAEPGATSERQAHSDSGVTLQLQTHGQAVSAESRQCYRASTAVSKRTATLDDESDCLLLDVSMTGFAVRSRTARQVGDIVKTVLHENGRTWSGHACIQSVREIIPGQWRYGLHCADSKATEGDLHKGLQSINLAVQREQLKRLSGAA